jgi:hypothetical protein
MNQRLPQRLTPVLVLLPLLLVGCEQGGQSDHPRIPQGKSESPLATSSGPSVNEEFVRLAETAMDELDNGIEELEAISSDVSPDIQAALDEQIEVLQEQQQAASQTPDELRGVSGEMQPYLQVHFISTWNEIVTSHAAANLLLVRTRWVPAMFQLDKKCVLMHGFFD